MGGKRAPLTVRVRGSTDGSVQRAAKRCCETHVCSQSVRIEIQLSSSWQVGI